MGLAVPAEYGGQGLPYALHSAVGEYMSSANMALMMYPGLTQGAIAAILAHGSDEQKADLPAEDGRGRLDRHHEPDRAALRHRPRPAAHQGRAAGRRQLQDLRPEDLHLRRRARLADNIVHLVLARIEGAPEGVKGISLFIVPKFMPDADGNPGDAQRASPAARSRRRWASTAMPPAS